MSAWSQARPVLLVDGRQQRDDRAPLDSADPVLRGGLGVFETLAVRDGAPVRLDGHLARLVQSGHQCGVLVPPLPKVKFWLMAALGTFGQPDAAVRILCTGGGSTWLRVDPLPEPRTTVSVATLLWPSPPFPPATAKHTSRAGGTLACRRHNVDEVLRLDAHGRVLEGTWSSVFAWHNDALHTAPADDGAILPGITRAALIQKARQEGIVVVEQRPDVSWTGAAWCLTSSLQGLVAVATVDGRPAPPLPASVEQLRPHLLRPT